MVAFVLGIATAAGAVPIQEHTGPLSGYWTPGVQFLGQSVTTPAGGPWDHIEFNDFRYSDLQAVGSEFAYGTLYLLDQLYTGLPADLDVTTPGFVARTPADSGTTWPFDPSVTLQPNTTYYFLNDSMTSFAVANTYDHYAGGTTVRAYYAPTFAVDPDFDTAFSLRGAPVQVPEPGAVLLLGAGLCTLVVLRRNANRRRT